MMRGMFIMVSVLVSLTACSMPETKIYSLALPDTAMIDTTTQDRKASLAIIMDAPRHLSQSYIVYRRSPYQLQISRYAKWESPPDEMVKKAIQGSLYDTGKFHDVSTSSLRSEGSYVLEINLKRFERTGDGNDVFGELAFDMKLVSSDNRELSHAVITKQVKLENRDFQSLAKGLSVVLAEAVREVTAKVIAH
ncbi:MAG: ABC-type transport auxiliary lipoprotein family protein [Thermodesulfovibrionales bacterium]|nr:ABC-type transport auxiliary lipoprotein family protein [Thermodesulfovibrionales bacterium]